MSTALKSLDSVGDFDKLQIQQPIALETTLRLSNGRKLKISTAHKNLQLFEANGDIKIIEDPAKLIEKINKIWNNDISLQAKHNKVELLLKKRKVSQESLVTCETTKASVIPKRDITSDELMKSCVGGVKKSLLDKLRQSPAFQTILKAFLIFLCIALCALLL